jgi:hypothetical protein
MTDFLKGLTSVLNIESSTVVRKALRSRNSINPSVLLNDVSYSVTVDGMNLTQWITSISVTLSEDKFLNEVDISFGSMECYFLCAPDRSRTDERLLVTIGPDVYGFLLEERSVSLNVSSQEFAVWGLSRAGILDSPYSSPIKTEESDDDVSDFDVGGLASEVISRYSSDLVVTFHSNLVDRVVLPNTLSVVDRTPIEVIKEAATALGAVVRSGLSNELILRPKYPDLRVINTLPVDGEITDQDDIILLSQEEEASEGNNCVLVEGPSDSFISLQGTWEIDEEASPSPHDIGDPVYLRLFLTPIISGAEGLVYETYSTDGTLTYIGEEEFQIEEELVDIMNGTGSLQYPALSLDNHSWLGTSPGNLSLDSYRYSAVSVDEDPELNFGVASVTYTTRCFRYILTDTTSTRVLIVAYREGEIIDWIELL